MSQHLAVEAIGIVDIKSQQFIVLDALRRRNNRFGNAAIAACRFLSRIPDEAKLRIIILFRGRAVSAMLFPPKDQTYLFKNADVFLRYVVTFLWPNWRFFWICSICILSLRTTVF